MTKLKINNFNVEQIANSGQCFRFNEVGDGIFRLVVGDRILTLNQPCDDTIVFDCPQNEIDNFWGDYFDLSTDYSAFIAAVPSDDMFLTDAVKESFGIRILRQPLFETLISFIISQRKSIPAIKTSIEALCRLCGDELAPDIYTFPTAEALAACSMDEILSCSVGYRARYILSAARDIAEGKVDLEQFHALDDETLLQALLEFSGVGVKVANCVRLFGYHRLAAFPEDVWILKTIEKYYAGNFPHQLYEGFAGVIQQYMFFYARSNKLA